MNPLALQILVYILIFAATVLAVEGGVSWFRSVHGERRQMNRRLGLIAKGMDRAEVLSMLRREGRDMHFAGPSGRFLTNVNRTMSQAGLIMPVARFVTLMVATAVGIVLLALVAIVALGSKVFPGSAFLVLLLAAAIGSGLQRLSPRRLRDPRICSP